MHSVLLMYVALAAAAVAAAAIAYCARRRAVRGERQRAEWARLAPGLRHLDEELNRTWAAEQERMRRHR